jgi:hypothetical protein
MSPFQKGYVLYTKKPAPNAVAGADPPAPALAPTAEQRLGELLADRGLITTMLGEHADARLGWLAECVALNTITKLDEVDARLRLRLQQIEALLPAAITCADQERQAGRKKLKRRARARDAGERGTDRRSAGGKAALDM